MQFADDQAIIAQTVAALAPYEDATLLAALKEVLEQRPSVVQELFDWSVPDRAYANARIVTDNRLTGTIKTFNEANGYGFIDCGEVKAAFNNDVFLHYRQLGGFNVGDEVTFTIMVNKERKPQAFDLGPSANAFGGKGAAKGAPMGGPAALAAAQRATKWGPPSAGQMGAEMSGNFPSQWFDPSAQTGKGKGKTVFADSMGKGGGGKAAGKVAWSPPEGSMEMEGVTDSRHDGIIKSFNEAKGFGFVACDLIQQQFGSDVFLHHNQFFGFEVGQAVSFGVLLNKDGKPQAKELAPLIPGGEEDPAAKRARFGL